MSKPDDFPMGVAVLDDRGRIRSLNPVARDLLAPAVEAVLGRRPESLIGVDVAALHRESARDEVARLVDARLAPPDPEQLGRTFLMPLNGSERTLLARLTPLRGAGNDNGTSLVFFDVTNAPLHASVSEAHESTRAGRKLIKIPVQVGDGIGLIAVEEVVRLEGRGHYTRVLTVNADYLSVNALGELERRLDSALFMRVHRSHVVNVHRVSGLHRNGESLTLAFEGRDSERVPVSRTHAGVVRKLFGLA